MDSIIDDAIEEAEAEEERDNGAAADQAGAQQGSRRPLGR
jgi:hypothetical protein